jgi:hypothetical protein
MQHVAVVSISVLNVPHVALRGIPVAPGGARFRHPVAAWLFGRHCRRDP